MKEPKRRRGKEEWVSYLIEPIDVLNNGYQKSLSVLGSSTACIVTITGNSLRALNLGDSGFRIVRDEKIIYGSKEQQHTFNLPYQLGPESTDIPADGDVYTFKLNDGDIIIIGTDGLFDNLYDEDLLSLLSEKNSAQDLAKRISREAYSISKSQTVATPFSDSAVKAGFICPPGGKEDDITVIVAQYNEIHSAEL